jgi:hypothetical protein
MRHKTIDLGEYIIEIDFDPKTNELDINVFDAAGEIIESMNISDSEDEDESEDVKAPDDNPVGISFNLN